MLILSQDLDSEELQFIKGREGIPLLIYCPIYIPYLCSNISSGKNNTAEMEIELLYMNNAVYRQD